MINPKFLYVCPRGIALAHGSRKFSAMHFIDLPDGSALVSGEFHDEISKDQWESHIEVEPVAPDGETVSKKHAQQLAHLGVKSGHRASEIRKLAKQAHKLM